MNDPFFIPNSQKDVVRGVPTSDIVNSLLDNFQTRIDPTTTQMNLASMLPPTTTLQALRTTITSAIVSSTTLTHTTTTFSAISSASPSPTPVVASDNQSAFSKLDTSTKIAIIGGSIGGLLLLLAIGSYLYSRFKRNDDDDLLASHSTLRRKFSTKKQFASYDTTHKGVNVGVIQPSQRYAVEEVQNGSMVSVAPAQYNAMGGYQYNVYNQDPYNQHPQHPYNQQTLYPFDSDMAHSEANSYVYDAHSQSYKQF